MKDLYDLIIVGAGPAGMAAAVYAARSRIDTLILTRDVGGMAVYAGKVDNYLGFHLISGMDLVKKFEEHLNQFPLEIIYNSVISIEKEENIFIVKTREGKIFKGKSIIYAAGTSHRKLGLKEEERFVGRGVTYCATCDAPLFRGESVMVVGGGNSAVLAALQLLPLASDVFMVNREEKFSAAEIYQIKLGGFPNLHVSQSSQVTALFGEKFLEKARVRHILTGKEEDLSVKGLFVEIGLVPNTEPVKKLVTLNEKNEVPVDCSGKTGVPGFFSAGDASSVFQRQIIIAAGEGAKAALSAGHYILNQ